MRLGVMLVRVVQVVGRHQRQVQVLGQAQEVTGDAPLDVQAVVHELTEVVLRPEDVAELRRGLQGFAVLAEPQPGLDLAGRAAGGGDEPFRVGVQQLTVQPGPFAEDRVQRGDRGGPEKVPHAHVVVAEQGHVRVRAAAGNVVLALVLLAPAHTGLVRAGGPGSHIGFDADDGSDALVCCALPEVEGAEQVAVVRRGEGRHAEPFGFVEQLTEPGGTVQHRVLGVVVEMDKRVVAGSHRTILVPCHDGGVQPRRWAPNGGNGRPGRTPWIQAARAVRLRRFRTPGPSARTAGPAGTRWRR
ncbi:hypothetical protein SRABI128_04982 [Microbacterium sp. Bi128]|nr:hypothetical protein SRABI128_04982 [Microbacterium sp. Bi128]